MCRFTLFLDRPIRLSSLPLDPEHSLIRQSTRASSTKWLPRYRFTDAECAGFGGISLTGRNGSVGEIIAQAGRPSSHGQKQTIDHGCQ